MTQIKLAAWNVARHLSDPTKAHDILSGIEQVGADIMVLSEAATADGQQAEFVAARFGQLGYNQVHTTEYQDTIPHPSKRQFIQVLSRLGNVTMRDVTLATREGVEITILGGPGEEAMRGIASHKDDRNEKLRHGMAVATLRHSPDFDIGDGNTMRADSPRAKLFRSGPAKLLAQHLPHPRYRNLAGRFTLMAQGIPYTVMTEWGGLVSANTTNTPTKTLAGVPLAELDYLLYNPNRIAVSGFRVHSDVKGSDHYPISATIQHARR